MAGRQFPYFIDWAITAKCNLNCRHCRGFTDDELSSERARRLVPEIAGLKPGWVIIEGGEPLLRGDLFELLGLMRQQGLEVHLVTNGMLLGPAVIANLKQLGIRLMISIDGATPTTYETVRRGARFETVVQAVRNSMAEGLLEAINFTILKSNYTEIPGIFRLAATAGVPKINLLGLKPCSNYVVEMLTPQEYETAIRLTCQAAKATGIEGFFDEPFFWAAVKEWGLPAHLPETGAGILAPTTACIFGEYLFLEVNGDVKPCSFAPVSLGNVKARPLADIWADILAFPLSHGLRDPGVRNGKCRDCRYLADCQGCRSRTYSLTDDWLASDPCCPLRESVGNKEGQ